ncbi:hypothetical protein F66182_17181, partial [Fusarium sp. NRRL 66182]
AASESIAWMCCSRVIAGFGVGFFICIIHVWSSEITSARRRGSHFSLLWCGNFLGIFSAYWVGYGLSFVNGGDSTLRWRLPLALQVVAPAIMIPAIWVMPESPRWLMKVGRNDEALKIVAVLRGNGNADHPDVKREYVEIQKTLEADKVLADFDSYCRLATDYKEGGLHYGRRALLAFGIQILVEAGFSTAKTGWLSGLNGATGLMGTIVAAFFCDRFGRRMNLMIGNALLGTWMWIYAGISKGALDHPEHQSSYGAAASSMILIFTFTLCVFWMIPCFIYAAEIFPTALRAKGNAFLVAGWGIGLGSGVLWFPIVVEKLGYKTFYIFGVANYVWIAVIFCFFPETAGRSLESIDLLFRSNSWFVWRNEKDYERMVREHEESVAKGLKMLEETGMAGGIVKKKDAEPV